MYLVEPEMTWLPALALSILNLKLLRSCSVLPARC
jgi:hypothetical protein